MKASEAPEKIYVHKSQYWGLMANEHDITKNGIEYVRTDAFIDKACDAYCKVCGYYNHTVPTSICRQVCDYYKDFKKYIEETKL